MRTVRKLSFKLGVLFFALIIMNGCKDDKANYTGINQAYITAQGSKALTDGESGQEINATLMLTNKVEKATPITLKITSNEGKIVDIVKTTPEKLIIKAGERQVSFKILLAENISIIDEQRIVISITPQDLITAKENLEIVVKPALTIQELSKEQRKLLLVYKEKGMDLTPFLGKIKVKTSIVSAADGGTKYFTEAFTKNIDGYTIITLSEQSTAEQPVLKMTENPMGMTEFYYDVLKKETIENDEYWYGENAGPSYAKVMDLIKWNKKSTEKFGATLDGIKIKMPKNNISEIDYVGKVKDSYNEEIDVVPFKFSYTAWDRLKKLIDSGNTEAKTYNDEGATPRPIVFLNNTTISSDEYEVGAFKPTTGTIDFKAKKMTFNFLTSHTNAGDYLVIKAEY